MGRSRGVTATEMVVESPLKRSSATKILRALQERGSSGSKRSESGARGEMQVRPDLAGRMQHLPARVVITSGRRDDSVMGRGG